MSEPMDYKTGTWNLGHGRFHIWPNARGDGTENDDEEAFHPVCDGQLNPPLHFIQQLFISTKRLPSSDGVDFN